MALIVFSHANSFAASTYGVLFRQLRARGFTVKAPDRFGHDPAYPVSNNWPGLIQQLHDFAAREVDKAGEPAFLVGHSLGGFLSILCAARHPQLARGVLLLDSPLIGGWKSHAVRAAKRTQLVGSISPGAVSRKRRNRWPSQEAALEHFRHKKAFARWDPQVLADYVAYGTHDEDGQRVLSFDREVETRIYNTLPDNMAAMLKRHPLRCPVAFIGGLQSEEIGQVGMAMTAKVTAGRITMMDGSHLFPMEKPTATAAAIEAALLAL
ncbi:alpha/beta hydrolase [Ramlibacter ginsenosidimutans]|uniref:Alpha/beta hydrolase n=1 Tax=Ramlibacter ginsenosidimutans TaxID=502333 RepID=A0A934WMU2_9BURK|nr:alpha/beta hydrolase [Ramlibacter ginsenosidimutans]MBK6008164.1 alpha/beta hydrolase [Ramlibacter ginsenosidimutans]